MASDKPLLLPRNLAVEALQNRCVGAIVAPELVLATAAAFIVTKLWLETGVRGVKRGGRFFNDV